MVLARLFLAKLKLTSRKYSVVASLQLLIASRRHLTAALSLVPIDGACYLT